MNIINKIIKATKSVSIDYQHLITATKDKIKIQPKKFERVWCYEFYHQLRNDNCSIFSEVSKQSHKIIIENFIPDFIIHTPGTMSNNHAVIELKTTIKYTKGIVKDFCTLYKMLNEYEYKIGVWILINHDQNDAKKTLQKILIKNKNDFTKNFDVESQFEKIYIITKDNQMNVESIKLKDLLS